jgi:hypothetical protein
MTYNVLYAGARVASFISRVDAEKFLAVVQDSEGSFEIVAV